MKLLQPLLALALFNSAFAKNILMSNDDGWASTNIRAAYEALTEAGHTVIISAPVNQRSGFGGTFHMPRANTMLSDGEFGYVKKGDPAWGHEKDNTNIWYFDGTPSSSIVFGLDYVIPRYFDNIPIDLVVNGPNEGTNIGPYLYTLSGTMGATYTAVERNIPAIAVSGSNSNNSFFEDDFPLSDTHPATINAKKVVQLVDYLFEKAGDDRVLPLGIGLNVNIPQVGDLSRTGLIDPQFQLGRLTGEGAVIPRIVFDEESGNLRSRWNKDTKTTRLCSSGNCELPSEQQIVDADKISITVFSTDYDARSSSSNSDEVSQVHSTISQIHE